MISVIAAAMKICYDLDTDIKRIITEDSLSVIM